MLQHIYQGMIERGEVIDLDHLAYELQIEQLSCRLRRLLPGLGDDLTRDVAGFAMDMRVRDDKRLIFAAQFVCPHENTLYHYAQGIERCTCPACGMVWQ